MAEGLLRTKSSRNVSGVAKIPGLDSVVTGVLSVMQAQTEALAALPGAVQSLSAAVKNLADATAGAKDTIQTMNRLAHRIEGIVEELEGPLKALAPGMERMAKVIDDPIVSTLPDALTQARRDLLPVLRTIAETNERIASLASLPGASTLLGWRRPASSPGS
ncbi:MAG: hypothetical protein QOJ09_378 [Actinomycetota bacterium]|nr:hypothetical protein [Actinomycetota bacterium]